MNKIKHLIWLFLLLGLFGKAQDTLYLSSGIKKNVVVKEITPTQIKFLDSKRLEGPVYTLDHSSVFKVVYSNGTADTLGILYPSSSPVKQNISIAQTNNTSVSPTTNPPHQPVIEQKQVQLVQSGDSLFFFNGTRKNVNVKEIVSDHILYSDLKTSSATQFNIHRSSVSCIKYADGFVDSLKTTRIQLHEVNQIKNTAKVEGSASSHSSPPIDNNLLITKARRDFRYQNRGLSEKRMILKTESFNLNKKDSELTRLINLTKREKKIQHVLGFGGPALLLASILATSAASNSYSGGAVLGVFTFIVAFPVCVTAEVISINHKYKRRKHARMTAERYNQLILQQ